MVERRRVAEIDPGDSSETKAAYGSPRIFLELKGRGIPVSKGRVERLMRKNSLRGRHKRRFKATTDSKHTLPVAPNLLEQNFFDRTISPATFGVIPRENYVPKSRLQDSV